MKFSKILTLAAFPAGVVFLAVLANDATANHQWGNYHWARTTPQFRLALGDNLTNDWNQYLYAVSHDWNNPNFAGAASTPILTSVVPGSSPGRCSLVSGTAQVCNGYYGQNGWLGLATVSVWGGVHITRASAQMNDSYFSMPRYNNSNQKKHVMCQEVAHTFGLDHQSESGESLNTCMDYFSNTGPYAYAVISTRPNLHDFTQLNLMYSHLDSFSTFSGGTNSISASEADEARNPKAWGLLVEQTKDGRGSKYQTQDKNGMIRVTHVYWSLETAEKCPGCDHRYHSDH